MKVEKFMRIKKRMDKWTDNLLFEKSKEYGTDDDRFDNIRTISRISGESVETCLKVLICKHIASYLDILDGKLEPTEEIIRDKFGDIHNYLYITEGVLREYNEKGESGVFHHGDTSPKDLDVPLTYEKAPEIPVVKMTKDEFEEELRKNQIREKAEKMYEDWCREPISYRHEFDNVIVNGVEYLDVVIWREKSSLTLVGRQGRSLLSYRISLPKQSKEIYLRIFEKLLTDPKAFIKSYFKV